MRVWHHALLAGALSFALTLAVRSAAPGPFAPGEMDLLWSARAAAAAQPLPIWAAAVHPDAAGTALEASLLSIPLRLGVPDHWALAVLGALHGALAFAVVVAVGVGSVGGAGWVGALALFAVPMVVGVPTRVQGTTSEALGIELLVLFAALRAGGHASTGSSAASPESWVGRLAGVAVFSCAALAVLWSRHAMLVVPAVGLLLGRTLVARLAAVLSLVAVAAFVPWLEWRLRPDSAPLLPPFTVRSMEPGRLLEEAWRGIASFAPERWIAALGAGSPWASLVVLPATALALAWMRAAVSGDPMRRGLAAAAAAAVGPLALAEAVAGWPEGARWAFPALGLLATVLTTDPALSRSRLVLGGLALASASTVSQSLALGAGELDRSAAAYVAAQHRLSEPRSGPFDHALLLLPWVRADELEGFAMGWGLHLSREFELRAPSLALEYNDARPPGGAAVPDAVDPIARKRDPQFLWAATEALPAEVHQAFARGVGLGVAEDLRISAAEGLLLDVAGDLDVPTLVGVHDGIAMAVSERSRIAGAGLALVWDCSPEVAERHRGWRVRPIDRRVWPLAEPLRYARHLQVSGGTVAP